MLVELRAAGASGLEGDRRSHEFIVAALRQARPGDDVLSEEGVRDNPSRQVNDRVWIVDPIDGTREFTEDGRVDWGVHIALWERGELVAGAVALPAEGLVFDTLEPPALPPSTPGRRRMVVSRSRPPAFVPAVALALGFDVVPHGSAGAKAMEVVRGRADAYLHAGGQYEWDSAAPVAVARSAGLHTSRIDGSPLVYNRPDPCLPDIVVCRPELADPILEAIALSPNWGRQPGI